MLKILSNTALTLQAAYNRATRTARRRAHMRRTWKINHNPRTVWWMNDGAGQPHRGQ